MFFSALYLSGKIEAQWRTGTHESGVKVPVTSITIWN